MSQENKIEAGTLVYVSDESNISAVFNEQKRMYIDIINGQHYCRSNIKNATRLIPWGYVVPVASVNTEDEAEDTPEVEAEEVKVFGVEGFCKNIARLSSEFNDWDFGETERIISASMAWFATQVIGIDNPSDLKNLMAELEEVVEAQQRKLVLEMLKVMEDA